MGVVRAATPAERPRARVDDHVARRAGPLHAAGVVGLILGIVALQQISRDGTTGRGYAIAGITVGAVGTAFVVLWVIAMAATSA
ncbi:DUF4190 domain-containing protein [Oerskovia sp. M15]